MQALNLYSGAAALFTGLLLSSHASALVLNGYGEASQLNGSLGSVDVRSSSDVVGWNAYLGAGGIVPMEGTATVQRVQYSMLNTQGNGDIFQYSVYFEPGTEVLGAGVPLRYIDDNGQLGSWNGLAYSMLFDKGYGFYDYQLLNGGQWGVDYQIDHITWVLFGNGFADGTAIGQTDKGSASPRFSILFPEGTELGWQRASVFGNNLSAAGQVLSAIAATPEVPVPAAAWLMGSGLIGLAGIARRRRV
jgi:hypothetical protein